MYDRKYWVYHTLEWYSFVELPFFSSVCTGLWRVYFFLWVVVRNVWKAAISSFIVRPSPWGDSGKGGGRRLGCVRDSLLVATQGSLLPHQKLEACHIPYCRHPFLILVSPLLGRLYMSPRPSPILCFWYSWSEGSHCLGPLKASSSTCTLTFPGSPTHR